MLHTVFCVALLCFNSRAGLGEECTMSTGVSLAHCDSADREFKTLLLTVHGWNGSCIETFGTHEGSLYAVLGTKPRFYDWDCLQYNTFTINIKKNADRLLERLRALKKLGYERISLVTHSTGGIITLEVIADLLNRPAEDLWMDIPRIAEVYAWATPINGLTAGLSAGARVLTALKISPQTLPDLRADSAYLKGLKQRLRQGFAAYSKLDSVSQGRRQITIRFLQGQGHDRVVKGIDREGAIREGWFLPNLCILTPTREGHTRSVGESGEDGVPRYPADLLDAHTLLSLTVAPRFETVFPGTPPPAIPRSLEHQQETVIKGLTYYSGENFTGAFSPALAFLARMYDGSFERSCRADEALVDGFLRSLQKRAGMPDDNLIRFFVSFTKQVLVGYDPRSGEDISKFGHRHAGTVQKVLETAEIIHRAVDHYIADNPARTDVLAQFNGSIDAFNAAMLHMTSRFISSPYTPVQSQALGVISRQMPMLSDRAILDSTFPSAFYRYYGETAPSQGAAVVAAAGGGVPTLTVTNRYKNLSAPDKSNIEQIYLNLLGRGPQLRDAAFASLNTTVNYRGVQRALWSSLIHDQAVRKMLAAAAVSATPQGEQFRFATEVVALAGRSGNDLPAASQAVDISAAMIDKVKDPLTRTAYVNRLRDVGARSKFPVIQTKVNNLVATETAIGTAAPPP
jgi:pimeloyl-ACP methyl ester carboxylesterase